MRQSFTDWRHQVSERASEYWQQMRREPDPPEQPQQPEQEPGDERH